MTDLDDTSVDGIARLRARLSDLITAADQAVRKEKRQQFHLTRLEGIAKAQARMLEPGSREGQRILRKVPPRARFSTLEANQPSHRVPNLLSFRSAEDLAITLATTFGVPRTTVLDWAAGADLDVQYTLGGPRLHHIFLWKRLASWQASVTALDDTRRLLAGWNRSILRSRGSPPPTLGLRTGWHYTSTADHLAQVERFYSMAAMSKQERCPDCPG